MAALAVGPFGPVAIEKFFVDVGFHFRFFFGGVALGVAGVVVAIGIDGGNEGECVAIRRPEFVVGAGGEGGVPWRAERKASFWPSGDQRGRVSLPLRVNWRGSPAAVGTSQMSRTE